MKHLLFVCIENSNRSQMAEAIARIHAGDGIEIHSAGSHPSGTVNPKAVEAMRQIDYDLSSHTSKSLNEIPDVEYDAVITMGCADKCPYVRAKFREEWDIPDPQGLPQSEFNKVRSLISEKVNDLLTRLWNLI